MADMTFPILKLQELISCSDELRVPITAADVREPQPAVVQKIFEAYLEMFLSVKVDTIKQPSFDAMMLDYPDLHEDSFPKLVMMAAMTRMFQACGIYDFSLQDITKPGVKRIKKLLSAVINFAKFREFQLGSVDELLEKREQLAADHSKALTLNAQMDEELASLAAVQEAEMPERQRLEGEGKEMMVKIGVLNKKQLKLQQASHPKRNALSDIIHTVGQEEFEISKLSVACKTLEGQIVQSPEILKQEIALLGAKLEQERENVVVLEKRGRELAVQTDRMSTTKTDIAKARKQLDEVEKEIARLNVANEDCEQTKEGVIREGRLLKESKAKEELLKWQIEDCSEKIARLSQQRDMKRTEAQREIEKARKDNATLKKEGGSLSNARESTQAQATFKAKVTERKEQHQQQIAAIREQHAHLVNKIYSYDDGLKVMMAAAC